MSSFEVSVSILVFLATFSKLVRYFQKIVISVRFLVFSTLLQVPTCWWVWIQSKKNSKFSGC